MTVPAPFVYNAIVTGVHDGDTFYARVDRGMYDYKGDLDKGIPIRLAGCNARELSDDGGPEALANLEALLPVGSAVVLTTVKPDKFAPRWDAYVETPALPDLTAYLIEEQWAAAWNGSGAAPVPPWPRTV